jgi:hypothetical protein
MRSTRDCCPVLDSFLKIIGGVGGGDVEIMERDSAKKLWSLRPRMRDIVGVDDVHHRKVGVLLGVAQRCVAQALSTVAESAAFRGAIVIFKTKFLAEPQPAQGWVGLVYTRQ